VLPDRSTSLGATMLVRGPHILLWLVAGTVACTACGTILDHFLPDLTFFGTVLDSVGAGVPARVEVQQRSDCTSPTVFQRDSTESTLDGAYQLTLQQVDFEPCYVLFASAFDGALISDTIRIPGAQLAQLGDPLGTGRIPLDIVVR